MLTFEDVIRKINSKESFHNVEIGDIDFNGHVFEHPIDLEGALFKGRAIFSGTHFLGDAIFRKAKFFGEANFDRAVFDDKISFEDVEFREQAIFGDPKFYDKTSLENREELQDAALFKTKAIFTNARFLNVAYFRGTKFFGETEFIKTEFKGRADFAGAKFANEVSFEEAQFSEHVTFGIAEFQKKSSFKNVIFNGTTYFGYAQFSEAIFNYSKFAKKTYFDGPDNEKLFSKTFPTHFISVEFQKPEDVMFRMANLSKCFLVNTDLSKVELTGIEWYSRKGLFFSRKAVYDEVSGEENKNYPLIEKLYRQLKKNFEGRGSYGEAGDFHYGEMEMRRLSHRGIFRYLSLTSLYKTLSGYGEKYWLALFWLCLFLLFFSLAYLILGMKLQTTNVVEMRIIQYNPALNFYIFLDHNFWWDYYQSLIHSLEIATFQRDKAFVLISTTGRLFEILETILIPIQVALSVLAVRRRFRR